MSDRIALTLSEAKAHIKLCIDRDDIGGLQKLLENPEPLCSAEQMRDFVEELTNKWPKLQAEAADRRERERLRKLDEPRERELEKLYAKPKSFMPDRIALTLSPNLWRVVLADEILNPKRVRNITVKGASSVRGAIDSAMHTEAFENFKVEFPGCGIVKVEFAGILDSE